MTGKRPLSSVKPDLIKSVAAYAATGLLGAGLTYGITELNRLPSRALTILPAGIHVIEGPTVNCESTQFIVARVNPYLDTDVKIPPCDVLLSKSQAADLVEGLEAAKQYYQSERIHFFQVAKSKLAAIAKNRPDTDEKLKEATLAAIGDLAFISRRAPSDLNGASLLQWAQTRIETVLIDVTAELDRMNSIITAVKGEHSRPARHTEFYFVATNSSDVEFYISTSCTVRDDSRSVAIVLEKVDRDDILSPALVYIPVLPGRGKLMKFSPRDEQLIIPLLLPGKSLQLLCTLANSKTIQTKKFDPSPFISSESTYVTD